MSEAYITIESEKQGIAQRLEESCRGAVQVTYAPTVHLQDDVDAEGHVYVGRLFAEPEEALLTMDDRRAAPLAVQAVRELRRIRDAADKAAAEFLATMPFDTQGKWFPSTRQPSAN